MTFVGVGERPGGDVEDEALESLTTAEVSDMLHRLPESQRDILLLRFMAGFTIQEIADVTGKKPGAVKASQRRGFDKVARMLRARPTRR